MLALAELRSAETGVGADRVLIAWGVIGEEAYVMALAASLHVAMEPLSTTARSACPLSDERLVEAAATGMLPLRVGGDLKIVVAPQLVDSRRLVEIATSGTAMARRIRLTSAARLQDFVSRHGAHDIAHRAVDELSIRFR